MYTITCSRRLIVNWATSLRQAIREIVHSIGPNDIYNKKKENWCSYKRRNEMRYYTVKEHFVVTDNAFDYGA